MSGTVSLAMVSPAITRARKLEIPIDDLLTAVDLTPSALADPDTRLPFDAGIKLWDEVARRSGSQAFGIEAASDAPPGHLDVHEYLVRCSPTLGSGLRRAFDYIRLLSSRGHAEVEVTAQELRIVNRPPGVTSRHGQECMLFLCFMIVQRAVGRAVPLVRLELMSSEPVNPKPLAQAFGCPIVFGAPANLLVFPRKLEDAVLPAHDERLLGLIERHAKTMVDALGDDAGPLDDRVRRVLFQQVQREPLALDRVARTLGMSGRTLQRDLRSAGTSFRDLADEVRRDVAISHMTHGTLPITAISLLLDFSEVSAFHRSFRRWTGQAPSAFRAAMRPSPDAPLG